MAVRLFTWCEPPTWATAGCGPSPGDALDGRWAPLRSDREADRGTYWEPNVRMIFPERS